MSAPLCTVSTCWIPRIEVELLALKDTVDTMVMSGPNVTSPVKPGAHAKAQSPLLASSPVEMVQSTTVSVPPPGSVTDATPTARQQVVHPVNATTHSSVNVSPPEVRNMLSQYEELTKKLHELMNAQSTQAWSAPLPTSTQPITQNIETPYYDNQSKAIPSNTQEKFLSLKDLSYLPRREFKVRGGQIDDHSSDISYNSVCRQIEEGQRENFTNSEIVRGVLRIIKPGDFKDMLMNKEDMMVIEFKGFL